MTDPGQDDARALAPGRRAVLLGSLALLSGCAVDHAGTTATQPPTASSAPATAASARPSATSASTSTAPVGVNGAGDLVHGDRSGRLVALTFHGAGDADSTHRVLAALRAARAHVTVFAVGSWLDARPDLGAAVLADGHEMGNHTYHHLPMRTLSAATARTEVATGAAAVQRVSGSIGRWFRPSGTPESTPTIRAAARAAGYGTCVSYDVDSLDWTDPGAAAVVRTVTREVRPGSIVSLHLGHAGTADAMPALLARLSSAGLHVVTVSELVA